jgi:hypothetical protein
LAPKAFGAFVLPTRLEVAFHLALRCARWIELSDLSARGGSSMLKPIAEEFHLQITQIYADFSGEQILDLLNL